MTNIYCLYWAPGSAGDLVQNLLIDTGKFTGAVSSFKLSKNGRYVPMANFDFVKHFLGNVLDWNLREWSDNDIDTLKQLANNLNNNILICTHDINQVEKLKNKANAITIGITYNENMFPSVLKSWCRKVAINDLAINNIYQNLHPELTAKLKKENCFGEFILKEQLLHTSNIPKSVDKIFDVNINLEDIYNQDLTVLNDLISEPNQEIFNLWYAEQDDLYKFSYPVNKDYTQCIGYNTKANSKFEKEIGLSSYDQMLLLCYCKKNNMQKPNVATNRDLVLFFETR